MSAGNSTYTLVFVHHPSEHPSPSKLNSFTPDQTFVQCFTQHTFAPVNARAMTTPHLADLRWSACCPGAFAFSTLYGSFNYLNRFLIGFCITMVGFNIMNITRDLERHQTLGERVVGAGHPQTRVSPIRLWLGFETIVMFTACEFASFLILCLGTPFRRLVSVSSLPNSWWHSLAG